jgi:opacity protein-like surface antigen
MRNQEKQKMSNKWFVFAVAAMLAGSALADENGSSGVTPNLDKGTKTLEGGGYVNVMGDEVQIQLSYGQFVADGIELALTAGLTDNEYYMSTELGVRAEYNLYLDSPFVPFVNVGAVWANAEADGSNIDTDAGVFSAGAGMKYFIRDNVALAAIGNYLIATDDLFIDSEDNEVNDDEFRVLFSVRFYFD